MSLLSIVAAVVLAVPPTHVTLVFGPEHPLPPAVERAALAEAAAIWSPYGVVVTRLDSARHVRDEDVVLTLVMSAAPAAPATLWQAPLGAVDFDASGTPTRVVTVFVDRLIRMLEQARLGDLPAAQWPRVIREQVVGRAIGRVIAHEIGHVLLRSKRHAARGLMRAVQRTDELVDPARGGFRLLN